MKNKRILSWLMAIVMILTMALGDISMISAGESDGTVAGWRYYNNGDIKTPSELAANVAVPATEGVNKDNVGITLSDGLVYASTNVNTTSLQATNWTVGSYWQAAFDATGYDNLKLTVSIGGSNSGPKNMKFSVLTIEGTAVGEYDCNIYCIPYNLWYCICSYSEVLL